MRFGLFRREAEQLRGPVVQIAEQYSLRPWTDEDDPRPAMMFRLVGLRNVLPDFPVPVHVARSYGADFNGPAAREYLNPHHIGNNRGKMRNRHVDNVFVNGQHRFGLAGLSPPLPQPGDGLESTVNFLRDKFILKPQRK